MTISVFGFIGKTSLNPNKGDFRFVSLIQPSYCITQNRFFYPPLLTSVCCCRASSSPPLCSLDLTAHCLHLSLEIWNDRWTSENSKVCQCYVCLCAFEYLVLCYEAGGEYIWLCIVLGCLPSIFWASTSVYVSSAPKSVVLHNQFLTIRMCHTIVSFVPVVNTFSC